MNQSGPAVLQLLLLTLVVLVMANAGNTMAASTALNYRVSEAQRVIDAVPIADRAYFVTFHLAMEAAQQGRNDISVVPGFDRIPSDSQFEDIVVPSNFGRNLLRWVEGIAANGQRALLLSDLQVCFPSGCVDPNDIGTNCCPF